MADLTQSDQALSRRLHPATPRVTGNRSNARSDLVNLVAEDTRGLKAILSRGWAYDLTQSVLCGSRTGRWMQREFIQAMPGERVLDVGCGTAAILSVLPDVDYVGCDISEPYIARAKARWGTSGRFHVQHFNRATLESYGKFDLILATGLLHHLDDDQVRMLFEALPAGLNPKGRIVTADCCYVERQNLIARFIINQDRGRNVRTPQQYAALRDSHCPTSTVG